MTSMSQTNGLTISVNDSSATIVESEENPKLYPPLESRFEAELITTIELSQLEDAKYSIFHTGCLPKWLLNFQNLQSLSAARSHVIVVEPWLLELKQLRWLNLEQNHITTWPYFLRGLENLEFVCLDGNPCLEKAFNKSPSLRSSYFNWNAAKDVRQSIPTFIRGPEWPPAANARLSKSSFVKDLDFYCGGIYTLSTPPDTSEGGLLTPLEPCVLENRLFSVRASINSNRQSADSVQSGSSRITTYPDLTPRLVPLSLSPTRVEFASIGSPAMTPNLTPLPLSSSVSILGGRTCACADQSVSPTKVSFQGDSVRFLHSRQDEKQSGIIFETFDDISALLSRLSSLAPTDLKKRVSIIGTAQDPYNHLLPNSGHLKVPDKRRYCQILLEEEDAYIEQLDIVNTYFCNAKFKSNSVANQLREVFTGFPAMLSIHMKWIRPNLRQLTQVLINIEDTINRKNGRVNAHEAKRLKMNIDMMIARAAVNLCTAFRHLHLALQSHARNLQHAETLLNTKHCIATLYEDPSFAKDVKAQISRMSGGFTGHLVTAASPRPKGGSSSDSQDKQTATTTLSTWLNKRNKKPSQQIIYQPVEFLYLPLMRLVRFERVFTSLAKSNALYLPLVRTIRWLRKLVATEMLESRRAERARILAGKFGVSAHMFDEYRWDAALLIRSRSYFEQGILSKNTNDVIDIDDNSVSFVKETYSPLKLRLLRLICCDEKILIFDDMFEQLIGEISHGRLTVVEHRPRLVTQSKARKDQLVRIVFVDVRETCLVQVKGFCARYVTSTDIRQEFIDACRIKNVEMI